ncbi:hypothetical protein JCM16303_007357 [Sporobolomyces ruberrimus]
MDRPTALSTLLPSYLPHEDLTLPLQVLASNGLSTDVDLVFGPRSLPPHPCLSPKLFTLFRSFASSNLSAPSTSGAVLFSRAHPPSSISTTLPSLDKLLGTHGYPKGGLVELVGTSSSGRTVLALYASLSYLLEEREKRVAYLDSTGTFDPFRCLSILKQVLIPRLLEEGRTFPRRDDSTQEANENRVEEKTREMSVEEIAMDVLDRISVSRVTKSGHALDKIVDEQAKEGDTKLGVAVIDQVDHLLGGEALNTTKSAQGHANLIAFTRRLSSLATSGASPLTIFLINTLVPNAAPPSSKSPSIHLLPSNPQPPPLTSLAVLSSFAPHGISNALSPALSESWSNLVDLSLVLIKSEDMFSTRGPTGGGGTVGRIREMVSIVEVGKNSKGPGGGGSGQLIGIKLVSASLEFSFSRPG